MNPLRYYHILMTRPAALLRCLLAVCLFFALPVHAQVYPVQVNTIIIPPYSPYTSDYVNAVNDKMIVNLLLRDVRASNVQVRLVVNIEGQGVKLTTAPHGNAPIITLDGGVPERLTGTDLAPYFNADNLVLSGITAAQYRQKGGQLPEGFYRICFDVYEVKTGAKLSVASGCANAWIVLNDPPLINFPDNNAHVAVKDPQYVTFQWTPRHKGSPNSAFNTEYVFQLVELLPGFNTNPQAAFLATTPLYETTTNNTMLVYGPGEPPLTEGRTYAFRVQAKSMVNGQEMDLFRNNGYSEIYSFIYQGTCNTPTGLTVTPKGSSRLQLSWQGGTPDQQLFVLSYRKAGVTDAAWFDETVNGNSYMLTGLTAATAYEFKVRANCSSGAQSSYTGVQQASTAAGDTTSYKCGVIPANLAITNQTPLPALKAGDEFTAGDFTINVTKVQGGNGHFTGTGYVVVPYLNDAKIAVSFGNVLINTDYQLAGGQVLTQYDASWSNIGDLDKYFEGGSNTGAVVNGKDSADITVPVVINKPADIKVTPADTGKGATLTITGSNGETIIKQVTSVPVTVKDAAGNIYSVTKDGDQYKVTQVAQAANGKTLPANPGTLATDKAVVRFAPHPQQVYAFDAWNSVYGKSLLFGAAYEKMAEDYYVPAKAIVAGKPDVVTAIVSIKDKSVNPDSIYFITGKGTVYTSSKNADSSTYTVNIAGGGVNDAQELYAVYKPTGAPAPLTLGKLLIAAYEQLERKAVLVPVDGNMPDVAQVEKQLNAVYDSIGVHWTVTADLPFNDKRLWDADGDSMLNVTGSGLFSTETAEMKALHNAYVSARGVEDKAVYLFVLKDGKGADAQALLGDMPRAKQFGYIFTNGNSNVGLTVAHEVGHGVFNLRHTFDGYGFTEDDLKDNLLNYHDGSRLTKMQWDAVHDPGVVWGVFDTDADAEEAKITDVQKKLKQYRNDDGSFTFLSIGGKPLTIKGKLSMVSFITSSDAWQKDSMGVPMGTLCAFDVDSVHYVAIKAAGSKQFQGYQSEKKGYYVDQLSILHKYKNVLVGIPCLQTGSPVFKVFPTDYAGTVTPLQNNQGEGTIPDLFFLDGHLGGADNGAEVTADIPALTADQITFIKAVGVDGNLCGEDALYAYKAANFIKFVPELGSCLNAALGQASGEMNQDERAQTNQPDALYVAKTYNGTLSWQESYKANNLGKDGFMRYIYVTLATYYNIDAWHKKQLSDLSAKDMADILNTLRGDMRSYSCLLRCLPITLRVGLLQKHTEWTITGSKESLMADLVENTPDTDGQAMLDAMSANNYALFQSLWSDVHGGDMDRIIGKLTYFLLKLKPNTDQSIVNWPATPGKAYEMVTTPFLYITKWDSGEEGVNEKTTATMAADGKITFTYLTSYPSRMGEPYNGTYTCDPYAYVHVKFANDYRFANIKTGEAIRKGGDVVAPAIWVYWIVQHQRTIENWNAVRIVADGIALIASAATAEPGPLVFVEAIANTSDIALTLAEDKIESSGTDGQKAFLKYWNAAYGMYGAVVVGKGLVTTVGPAGIRYAIATKQVLGDVAASLTKSASSAAEMEAAIDKVITAFKSLDNVTDAARNMFYSTMIAWKLNANVLARTTMLADAEILVTQSYRVAYAEAKGYTQEVASIRLADNGDVVMTDMRWYNEQARGRVVEWGAVTKDASYESAAGKAAQKGDIEYVKTADGNVYVRLFDAAVTEMEKVRNAMMDALGVDATLGKQLAQNTVFAKGFKDNARIIQVLKNEYPAVVKVNGTALAKPKEAFLKALLADDKLMGRYFNEVENARAIFLKGNMTDDDFALFGMVENDIRKAWEAQGYGKVVYAGGLFNTAVYETAALEGTVGASLLSAKRAALGLPGTETNIMYAVYKVDGKAALQETYSVSGKITFDNMPPVPQKATLGQFFQGQSRLNDSESKFLEWLSARIDAGEISGLTEMKLYSERPVCPSCTKAIYRFQQKYGVKVTIFEGKVEP